MDPEPNSEAESLGSVQREKVIFGGKGFEVLASQPDVTILGCGEGGQRVLKSPPKKRGGGGGDGPARKRLCPTPAPSREAREEKRNGFGKAGS